MKYDINELLNRLKAKNVNTEGYKDLRDAVRWYACWEDATFQAEYSTKDIARSTYYKDKRSYFETDEELNDFIIASFEYNYDLEYVDFDGHEPELFDKLVDRIVEFYSK